VFPFGTGGVLAATGGALPFGGTASSTGGATSSGGTPAGSSGGASGAPVASGGVGGVSNAAGGVSTADASSSGGSAVGDAGADASGGDASADGPVVTPVPPPAPVGCITAAALTPGVHQVGCDTTIHVLTVPEACTKTACGVIVDVHGGMMSSQMEDKNTNLSALGVKHGYLVIQPNALQNPILLNQRLFTADAPGVPGDDTRVMNILTQVMQAFHADPKRVHMTGFSDGGFMTWRWFCKHPDMLASVAPGAAAWKCATLANLGLTPPEIGCEFTGTDVPARNVPVLFMQGTKDGLVEPPCVDAWLKSNVYPTLKLDAGTKVAGDTTFAHPVPRSERRALRIHLA